jgi:hypothetical protein
MADITRWDIGMGAAAALAGGERFYTPCVDAQLKKRR